MDENRLNAVTGEYSKRYQIILSRIWPTIGSNGFNEHNQTANFLAAYEKIANEYSEVTSTWYEFQIANGGRNNNRIDGMIINHTNKTVYLLEAKRFTENEINDQRHKLGEDVSRLVELDLENRFNQNEVFIGESIQDYTVYGVILFDLWTYSQRHKFEKEAHSLWLRFCKNRDIALLSEFLFLKPETRNRIEAAKESFLATIQEPKRYENCEYHLGVFAFQYEQII